MSAFALPDAASAADTPTGLAARHAFDSFSVATPVTAEARQSLDGDAFVLEDPGAGLDLDAIRRQPPGAWQAASGRSLGLAVTRSTRWLKLRLRNDGPARERMLDATSTVQDHVDAWVVRRDGRVLAFPPAGDRVAFSGRAVPCPEPAFPIAFAAGETLEVFVRLASHDGLQEAVALRLWAPGAFFDHVQTRLLFHSLYYGVLLSLLVFGGFVLLSTRAAVFGYYLAYVASFLAWTFTYNGHGLQYLWPESPTFNNQVLPLGFAGSFVFASLFLGRYLSLACTAPRWHRLLRPIVIGCAVAAAPAVFGFYALPVAISLPLGIVWSLGIMLCQLRLVGRRSRRAAWATVAGIGLVAAALLYGSGQPALLPPTFEGVDAIMIGSVLQFLAFGIGLADTLGRMRRDKESAERAAQAAQSAATERLGEVRAHTNQLEEANRRLGDLANTDELTGVYNRRHFNRVVEAELRRLGRSGEMPALCLFDIDDFKGYNDRYGHHKGDRALRAVAGAVQACLGRRGDALFRVGGEEFAVLLQPADAVDILDYVETLRAAVETLDVPHAGSALGRLTASFGLVQQPPGKAGRGAEITASALYREADRLLYAAKKAGRNRVVSDVRPPSEWARTTDFVADACD